MKLIVSSTHLDRKFGRTISEIKSDGISPSYLVPVHIDPTENLICVFKQQKQFRESAKHLMMW